MRVLLAVGRLIALIAVLVWHATPLWIRAAFGPIDWQHHQAVRQKFARNALKVFAVKVHFEGTPPKEACIYASNHRSWLDPFVQLAYVWAFPVAKAEVGNLPFIAQGAKATGILFVDRSNRSSRRKVIDEMIATLRRGHSILIYPEGTTSDLPGTRAFQRGGFSVAEEAGVLLVPMVIRYTDPSIHWGENQSLWHSFLAVGTRRRTDVSLVLGEPRRIHNSEADMVAVRQEIEQVILASA